MIIQDAVKKSRTQQEKHTMASKPIHKIRIGRVIASVWEQPDKPGATFATFQHFYGSEGDWNTPTALAAMTCCVWRKRLTWLTRSWVDTTLAAAARADRSELTGLSSASSRKDLNTRLRHRKFVQSANPIARNRSVVFRVEGDTLSVLLSHQLLSSEPSWN